MRTLLPQWCGSPRPPASWCRWRWSHIAARGEIRTWNVSQLGTVITRQNEKVYTTGRVEEDYVASNYWRLLWHFYTARAVAFRYIPPVCTKAVARSFLPPLPLSALWLRSPSPWLTTESSGSSVIGDESRCLTQSITVWGWLRGVEDAADEGKYVFYCIKYFGMSSFICSFYPNPIVYRQTRRFIFQYTNMCYSRNKIISTIRQLGAIFW